MMSLVNGSSSMTWIKPSASMLVETSNFCLASAVKSAAEFAPMVMPKRVKLNWPAGIPGLFTLRTQVLMPLMVSVSMLGSNVSHWAVGFTPGTKKPFLSQRVMLPPAGIPFLVVNFIVTL